MLTRDKSDLLALFSLFSPDSSINESNFGESNSSISSFIRKQPLLKFESSNSGKFSYSLLYELFKDCS